MSKVRPRRKWYYSPRKPVNGGIEGIAHADSLAKKKANNTCEVHSLIINSNRTCEEHSHSSGGCQSCDAVTVDAGAVKGRAVWWMGGSKVGGLSAVQ